MMKVFLLVTLVASVSANVLSKESQNYAEHLLAKLNTDIRQINNFVLRMKHHHRDEGVTNSPPAAPRNYESTLTRASTSIGRALKLMESIEVPERGMRNSRFLEDESQEWTRRSNNNKNNKKNDFEWKNNFYKALSRALKEEFRDDKLIQDHVHDGFVSPTLSKKRA